MVRRARDGDRHPGAPHRQRAARDRDVVPLEQPHLAALRRGVRAPQRLAARAGVPRRARGHRRQSTRSRRSVGSTWSCRSSRAYRPFWLGLGAVALDLLLALVVTSLLRHRLGYRTWRIVHWLAYACWPVAVLHGLGTGSDTTSGLVLVFTAVCVVAVLVAAALRVGAGLRTRPGARALGLGARRARPAAARRVAGLRAARRRMGAQGRDAGERPRGVLERRRGVRRRCWLRLHRRHHADHDTRGERRLPGVRVRRHRPRHAPPDRARRQRQGRGVARSARCPPGRPANVDVELTGRPLADGGVSMRRAR